MVMAVLDRGASAPARDAAQAPRAPWSPALADIGRRAARRLVSPTFEAGSLHVFVRDLRELLPSPKETKGIWLEVASPAMIPELLEFPEIGLSRRELEERFARADLCFVASDGAGRLAHVRWSTKGRVHISELGRDLLLPDNAAYFYDGATRADLRRLGIDGLVRSFIFATLRRDGYDRVYSLVRGDNAAGLRAAGRWQRPCARLCYVLPVSGRLPLVFGGSSLPDGLGLSLPPAPAAPAVPRRRAAWRERLARWSAPAPAARWRHAVELPDADAAAAAAFIAAALELSPRSGRVLGVGGGRTALTGHVAAHCDALVAVDCAVEVNAGPASRDLVTRSGKEPGVLAANGCRLPFPDGSFAGAYTAGVAERLATHDAGLQMMREMVRVCAPNGRVLVAGLPATGKGPGALRTAWRSSGALGRLRLIASFVLPAGVKRFLRRRLDLLEDDPGDGLRFDLPALCARLSEEGAECRVTGFPEELRIPEGWAGRANLLIHIGGGGE